MKKLTRGVLLTAMLGSQLQAVDLKTDAVCNGLRIVIEQGQDIEKVKVAFEKVIFTAQLSPADKRDLVAQLVAYSQDQQEGMQKKLVALGDKTYDVFKIMWGSGQLAGGALCAACVLKVLWICIKRKYLLESLYYLRFSKFYWDYLARYIEDYFLVPKGVKVLAPIELVVYTFLAPYLGYNGVSNLYQGIYHKKLLADKIVNLNAIISHFQKMSVHNQEAQDAIA